MSKKKNSVITGFTLVELSIVIIIISFLISGIVAGQSLIKQSEVTAIIRDLSTYSSSIRTFNSIYGYIPGDFPNASIYWSSVPSGGNGNGDGLINSNFNSNTPIEDTYVWNHLSLAKLINGNFSGGLQPGIRLVIGINVPATPRKNTGYWLVSDTVYTNPVTQLALEVGSMDHALEFLDNSALTPQEAYSIDNKIDDGRPAAGIIKASVGYPLSGQNFCVDAIIQATTTTANYILTDTTVSCRLFYIIELD